MDSIIGRLEKWVDAQPDALLYAFLNGAGDITESYTYREFHERSNHLAAHLGCGRVRRGQSVLLVYPPGLEFIVAFFACAKLGAVPVPVSPPDRSGHWGGVERLGAVAKDSGARVVLSTGEYLTYLRAVPHHNKKLAELWARDPLNGLEWWSTDDSPGRLEAFGSEPASPLFLQYTSGSTQAPRGVVVSHTNVLHNCDATIDHVPIGVSWLPHFHDMGLIGYYLFLMARGGCVFGFSPLNFLKRPLLWLESLSRFQATATSAPNFAFDYCLRKDKVPEDGLAGIELSSVRFMANASETVSPSTQESFLARFHPYGLNRRALFSFYGLAENTLSVTGEGRVSVYVNSGLLGRSLLRIETPRGEASTQTRLASCGRPRPGIEVRIVEPMASLGLGEGQIGEIWVAGESKACGYWNNPSLSQEVFGASIRDEESGTRYLRTGDLGFLHEGELYVCGRLKDLIIIGGRNYFPGDIEAAVEKGSDLVRPGRVAAISVESESGEALVILLEPMRPNELPDPKAIWSEVRKRCQLEASAVAIVPHGAIPRTSSGKVARHVCRQRWLEGQVETLLRFDRSISSTGDPILDLVETLAASADDRATLAELGVDSLTLVDLSLHLEQLARDRGVLVDGAYEGLFDLRLQQAVTVGDLKKVLVEARSGNESMAAFAIRDHLDRLRNVEVEEQALMRRDAVLPADIGQATLSPSSEEIVLLSGATGFLGSFLLESLLRMTDAEIITLVRAEDARHAKVRIEAALVRTGLLTDELRDAFAARVSAWPGDLARPNLGLGFDRWERLAHELSGIYHCGAKVDYVQPYVALRGANVDGTTEILRLAATGAKKEVHHVSTTFIFGFGSRKICYEADRNQEMQGLNFGYPQTKWVSEQLVHEAARRGTPTRIYRPALVTASARGRYAQHDLIARILVYMIKHGVSVNSRNQLSLIPVDVCATNIVAMSRLERPTGECYHLTAAEYYTMEDICRVITQEHGYPFTYMSLERMIAHVNENCASVDPLYPLVAFFNHNLRRIDSMADKRYDRHNYTLVEAMSGACVPEPDLKNTVGSIVSFLQRENLVPRMRSPSAG